MVNKMDTYTQNSLRRLKSEFGFFEIHTASIARNRLIFNCLKHGVCMQKAALYIYIPQNAHRTLRTSILRLFPEICTACLLAGLFDDIVEIASSYLLIP